MKHTALKLTALAIGAVVTAHAALVPLGDNAGLFLTGNANLRYDDNIYLSSTKEKASSIVEVVPGLEYDSGTNAVSHVTLSAQEGIVRYLNASSQDTEIFSANATATYDDTKVKADLKAGFHQEYQNTRDARLVGTLNKRDVTNLSSNGEMNVSQKTSLGAGFTYDKTKYKNGGFSDLKTYAIPVNAFYEVTPKLQSSIGYRYRNNEVTGAGADSTENFFNVGARGDFTPKLQGTVTVGYNERSLKRTATTAARKETGLGVEMSLSYLYSQKTTFHFTVDNGFDTAATGDTEKVFGLSVGASAALSETLSVDATLAYHQFQYLNAAKRDDDYFNGSVDLTYKYNAYLNLGAGYAFSDNSSTVAGAEFKDNIIRCFASIRY